METDRQLYIRARRGDGEATEALIDRHGHALIIKLRDWAGKELAEDVAQESWLAVFTSRTSWHEKASFRTWLFKIAWREALRQRRITSRCASLLPPRSPTRMSRRVLFGEVITAIERLENPHQREVAKLYWLRDFTTTEIASLLDVPTRTVQSRLRAAKQKLSHDLITRTRTSTSTRP